MENNPSIEGEFFAHGKLLLAGEYFVLDGALAFAIPTQKGQFLNIKKAISKNFSIHWKSFEHKDQVWFEAQFALKDLSVINTNDQDVATRLQIILKYIQEKKPVLFQQPLAITTKLEFDRNWGLGTSSTLLANLAAWAKINPYDLAQKTFGGSGYDLACAQSKSALFFQKNITENATEQPTIIPHIFNPAFIDNLFLVWLGKKQDSRQGIETYRSKGKVDIGLLRQISQLSLMLAKAADLATFCSCIQELERLTGDYIEKEPLQENIFKGIPGAVKSLGAWGGDFCLIASPWKIEKVKEYCMDLGLVDVYGFGELVIENG